MAETPTFAVLGGGVSGLVASYFLQEKGFCVDLYEKEEVLGGLASPVAYEGKLLDRYYHFLCVEDQAYVQLLSKLGLKDRVKWKATKMGYFVNGSFFPFQTPLHLLQFSALSFFGRLRYALGALQVRRQKEWCSLDALFATDYLQKTFGKEAFQKLWQPLVYAKFNRYAQEVSGAWMWARIHRVATSRSKTLWKEWYGYVEKGTSTFLWQLLEKISGSRVRIFLKCPVERIELQDKGYAVFSVRGRACYDRVISTLPLPVLKQKALFLERWLAPLENLTYMGVVVVVLILKRFLSPFFWLNIVDSRIPFSVLVSYSHLDPRPDLGGKLFYIPYYLPWDHAFFCRKLKPFEETVKGLKCLFPSFSEKEIQAHWVFQDYFAQPVCPQNFGKKVVSMETPFPRFYVIESTQLYPRDRTISGQISLVQKLFKNLEEKKELFR